MIKMVSLLALLTTLASISDAQTGVSVFGRSPVGKYVVVDVTNPWTSTGIYVQQNDTILIFAWGVASSLFPENLWYGPTGNGYSSGSPFPVTDASQYSLVAKLGNRQGFAVGETQFLKNDGASDTLYLGFNDIVNFNDNYGYFLALVIQIRDGRVVTAIGGYEEGAILPRQHKLLQNFPNPFNPQTTIDYEVVSGGDVVITVYDVNGRLIRDINQGDRLPGRYSLVWDGKDGVNRTVASGTYFYQLRIGSFVDTKKMILLR